MQGTAAIAPTELVPVKRRVRLRDIATTMPVARMIGVRDIKIKYKQAALGPLWIILAPLGLLAAVTIAFSGVTDVQTGSVPYVLFALTGLAAWTYIQLTLMVGTQAIVGNSSLVRRSPCPRIAFVTATLISNSPPALLMITASVIGAAISGHLGLEILLLPLFAVWLLVLAGATVLIVASISVRFRDLASIVPLIVQAGMFVTPVGYSLHAAPANIKIALTLNPASGVIEAFRWALLGTDPNALVIGVGLGLTLILALAGWTVFARTEVRFADYV